MPASLMNGNRPVYTIQGKNLNGHISYHINLLLLLQVIEVEWPPDVREAF